ncbi:MAG: hypothetical protein ACLT4D_07965 [Blautia faecis]
MVFTDRTLIDMCSKLPQNEMKCSMYPV